MLTPEERARRWVEACTAKANNYVVGVRAAQAKVAERFRMDDEMALKRQLDEIQALPEKVA